MKLAKTLAICALGMGVSLTASAMPAQHPAPNAMPPQHPDQCGPTIVVNDSQPNVVLSLDSNATTGYQWYVTDYNQELLKLSSYQYLVPDTKAAGAPGKAVFTFKALPSAMSGPQMTRINLVYVRGWDMQDKPKMCVQNVVFSNSK